jgi:predicted DNA-binding protein YlxM (UPF0122 family)
MARDGGLAILTKRQAEAAALFHNGFSHTRIAEMLGISRRASVRLRQRGNARLAKLGHELPTAMMEPKVVARVRVVQGSSMLALN